MGKTAFPLITAAGRTGRQVREHKRDLVAAFKLLLSPQCKLPVWDFVKYFSSLLANKIPGVRQAYLFYFRRVLPRLGRWISGDREGAYDYLPDSVMSFPDGIGFQTLMGEAGLERLRRRPLSCGIATLYRGDKPERTLS